MKLVKDQAGIIDRYIREKENWDLHLSNTKNYIIGCLSKKKINSVSILGSGWLLDLPIEFLAGNIHKIYLYDIYHPRQVMHKLKNYNCFEFITLDITGGLITDTYGAVKHYKKKKKKIPLNDLNYQNFQPVIKSDYYISLAILNQLDILLTEYLEPFHIYSNDELNFFRSKIQESHISFLPVGKSCLITDHEELVHNMKNELIDTKSLLYTTLPGGKNKQTWQWIFDTTGSYNIGYKTTFNVIAMEI
jgi:hypothetical protein